MFRMRNTSVLVAGLLAAGTMVSGAGVAQAAPPQAVSDTIHFKGHAGPGPGSNTFIFNSTSCKLKSDAESATVACKHTGSFTPTSATTAAGSATISSADGTTTYSFVMTRIPGTNKFKVSGQGKECDHPEGGVPAPCYAANVKGNWVLVPNAGGFAMTGVTTILESTTAP